MDNMAWILPIIDETLEKFGISKIGSNWILLTSGDVIRTKDGHFVRVDKAEPSTIGTINTTCCATSRDTVDGVHYN